MSNQTEEQSLKESDLTEVVIQGRHFLLSPVVAEEILSLRSQDEVHWKTRCSLLAEIDRLKQQLEAAALDIVAGV